METAGWYNYIYIYIYKKPGKKKNKRGKKMEKLRKEELAEKPSAIKIKALRTERNLTQKEFSEWLQIPLQTVKQWELGLRSAPQWLLNLIEYRCEKSTQGEQITFDTLATIHIKTKMNEWEQIVDSIEEAEEKKFFWEQQGATVYTNIYKKI